jgi:hypothetical protein
MGTSAFRKFKAQLVKNWAAKGFSVVAGALVAESDSVSHTIMVRLDNVGRLELGLWVRPKNLPPEIYETLKMPGPISVNLGPLDYGSGRQSFGELLAEPEAWASWQEGLFEEQVRPWLLRLATSSMCDDEVRQKPVGVTVNSAYRTYLGMVQSSGGFIWGPGTDGSRTLRQP